MKEYGGAGWVLVEVGGDSLAPINAVSGHNTGNAPLGNAKRSEATGFFESESLICLKGWNAGRRGRGYKYLDYIMYVDWKTK